MDGFHFSPVPIDFEIYRTEQLRVRKSLHQISSLKSILMSEVIETLLWDPGTKEFVNLVRS